ncbi:uncharacterized protein [Elaeis guineensis]|uniref:uncharacterized protein isoform X1 n=1 Tax=Elaeis guineensis var. tenera TaxID=51953 RepID=UPI003C6D9ED2
MPQSQEQAQKHIENPLENDIMVNTPKQKKDEKSTLITDVKKDKVLTFYNIHLLFVYTYLHPHYIGITLREFIETVGILQNFKNYNSEESTADSGQHDELNEVDKDTETQVTRKGKRKLVYNDNE